MSNLKEYEVRMKADGEIARVCYLAKDALTARHNAEEHYGDKYEVIGVSQCHDYDW